MSLIGTTWSYIEYKFSPPYVPAKRRQNSRVQSPPVSGKEPRLRRCWLIGGRLFRHIEQDIRHCQFFQHLFVVVTEVHWEKKRVKNCKETNCENVLTPPYPRPHHIWLVARWVSFPGFESLAPSRDPSLSNEHSNKYKQRGFSTE